MPDVISGQATQAAPDPVSMISALLDAEKVVPETKPEAVAQPEEDADETPGNNAQVEGEDAPAAEGENSAATAEIPLDQLEAIELETTYKGDDGKDITEKLPIKELRQGYMRQRDYQRKTAEVARQREDVASTVRQGIESERTQYANTLQQLQDALIETVAPELKNVNWNDLAENNTFEYVRLSNRQNQIKQALETIKTKQQEANSKIDADRRQAAQATAQKTWATLESEIPGWNADIYQAALKSTESVGYTAAESGTWLDPRAIKLAHKAYLYDQLKAGQPPASKKVSVPPKVIKPGATSTASKSDQQKSNAMERLRKSGKLEDMTNVIASMI